MKLQGIKKTIGNFQLSVDELLIEEGKIHGLVGHNGAGCRRYRLRGHFSKRNYVDDSDALSAPYQRI